MQQTDAIGLQGILLYTVLNSDKLILIEEQDCKYVIQVLNDNDIPYIKMSIVSGHRE